MRLRLNNPSEGYKDVNWVFRRLDRSLKNFLEPLDTETPSFFLGLFDIWGRGLSAAYREKILDKALEFHQARVDCGKAIFLSWLNPGTKLSHTIKKMSLETIGRRDVKYWGYGFWDAFLLRDQATLIDFADYISQRMDIDPDYPKNPFQEAQLHYQMALFRGQPNRQALAQKVVDSYRREFLGDFQLEINYQRVILPAQCRLAIESGDEKAYNETLIQLIQAEVQNYLEDPEDTIFHNYQETINCLAAQAHAAGLKRNFESDLIFGEIERGEWKAF